MADHLQTFQAKHFWSPCYGHHKYDVWHCWTVPWLHAFGRLGTPAAESSDTSLHYTLGISQEGVGQVSFDSSGGGFAAGIMYFYWAPVPVMLRRISCLHASPKACGNEEGSNSAVFILWFLCVPLQVSPATGQLWLILSSGFDQEINSRSLELLKQILLIQWPRSRMERSVWLLHKSARMPFRGPSSEDPFPFNFLHTVLFMTALALGHSISQLHTFTLPSLDLFFGELRSSICCSFLQTFGKAWTVGSSLSTCSYLSLGGGFPPSQALSGTDAPQISAGHFKCKFRHACMARLTTSMLGCSDAKQP